MSRNQKSTRRQREVRLRPLNVDGVDAARQEKEPAEINPRCEVQVIVQIRTSRSAQGYSTSASSQQFGEVCSVTTAQPENLDVTTVEPIEEHYSEASYLRTDSGLLHKVHVTRETRLSPKAKKLYKIASQLSRANRRLSCRRRLIRSTRTL
ncbi:unnamed protein product [Acanthoscelides obtectus]|uniref:Uncharacterized protein n=1 Tax=Acanthoscelides obtectus TaxID=200917 RepID=A0A9P0JV33_ACAOB|nr:unnamed protein product [Acanthoscelides obtectus]CAK1671263.1 hypothetical protein AOBTE_LOCUS28197 [Acanthoscelides obtectus]